MASIDEQILRTSKEIVVKFIETGRISPNTFPEFFRSVYYTVAETVKGPFPPCESDEEEEEEQG